MYAPFLLFAWLFSFLLFLFLRVFVLACFCSGLAEQGSVGGGTGFSADHRFGAGASASLVARCFSASGSFFFF